MVGRKKTKIKFVGSFSFMSSSLSSLADSLSGGIHCCKCINCKSYLDYMISKDDELIFRRFECKNNYNKDLGLIKRFPNLYEFCNKDINEFILILRKGIYQYQYMDT